jgi:hypothetical protein
MRCDDIRECLDSSWESRVPPEVRKHVAECGACERYLRDLSLVRAGFRVLRREAVPEPSWGFTERLVRQLGELATQPSVGEFFEQIGRRFVYTTLVLTVLTLMALILPSTGPVREQQAPTELLMSAQEATLTHADLLGDTLLPDAPDMPGGEASAPAPAN